MNSLVPFEIWTFSGVWNLDLHCMFTWLEHSVSLDLIRFWSFTLDTELVEQDELVEQNTACPGDSVKALKAELKDLPKSADVMVSWFVILNMDLFLIDIFVWVLSFYVSLTAALFLRVMEYCDGLNFNWKFGLFSFLLVDFFSWVRPQEWGWVEAAILFVLWAEATFSGLKNFQWINTSVTRQFFLVKV